MCVILKKKKNEMKIFEFKNLQKILKNFKHFQKKSLKKSKNLNSRN